MMTIGDLSARHLGLTVTIPDLHQPGTDWDAPKVAVTGRLEGLERVAFGRAAEVWVRLSPRTSLDRPLPLSWPVQIGGE